MDNTTINLIKNPDFILEYLNDLNLENTLVYIAGSIMEGFGNSSSDIDVYVICDSIPLLENQDQITQRIVKSNQNLIRNVIHDGIRLDYEYWTWQDFKETINKLNSLNFHTDDFKAHISSDDYDLLHRVKFGQPVLNKDKFYEIYESINFENLSILQVIIQSEVYRGLLEDLQGAYLSKDYGTAFFLSRQLLERMITSYLAANGETNPNSKWIYRKALRYQKESGDTELLSTYIKLQNQPYDLQSVDATIQENLRYAQILNTKAQEILKIKQIN